MKIDDLIRRFIRKTNIYEKLPYPFVAVVRQVFNLGFDRLRQIFDEDKATKRTEFFAFLNRFGITEVYLSDVSLKDAGWIKENNAGQGVRIARSRGEDPKKVYITTALSFSKLFKGFSISDIDEMIRINVSNLASGYDKILFLKAGNVGDEIVRLLEMTGKKFEIREPSQVKIRRHKIIVDKEYDVVFDCMPSGCDHKVVTMKGKTLFHMPFWMGFQVKGGTDTYGNYEWDIVNNLLPRLRENGVNIAVIENLCKYKFQTPYDSTPNFYYKRGLFTKELDAFAEEVPFSTFADWPLPLPQGRCIVFSDHRSEHINWVAGERVTPLSTYDDKPDIYFFGPCIMFGSYVIDDSTIPAFLQKKLLGVANCHNMSGAMEWTNIRLRTIPFKPGDTVVLMAGIKTDGSEKLFKKAGVEVLSLKECYEGIDPKEYIWDIPYHSNSRMNKRIADCLYGQILKFLPEKYDEGVLRKRIGSCYEGIDLSKLWLELTPDFKAWYEENKHYYKPGNNGVIYANCNPYTNGHDRLIRKAATQVDTLYVIVVEEDASTFSFADRFEMVKQGTADIANVVVMRSGKFCVSFTTLSGYFDKEKNQERVLFDAVNDLCVEFEAVAPLFDVKHRFVGEEPTDAYTARYNLQMEMIGPEYGIRIHEIPRFRTTDGQLISGTYVRKLFMECEWEELGKYVPETTRRILQKIRHKYTY